MYGIEPLEIVVETIERTSGLLKGLLAKIQDHTKQLIGDYEIRLANRKAMVSWIIGSPEYQCAGEQLILQYDSLWTELQRQFYSVGKDRYIVRYTSQIGEITFQYIISRKRKETDSFPIHSHPDTIEEGDEVVFLRIRKSGQKIRTILALQQALPYKTTTS